MKIKTIVAVIIVVAVAGLIVMNSLKAPVVEVWIASVEKGEVEATVANTRAGTVKACRRSKLSMPTGGVVDRLLVKEGDRVKQGQLLLELWNHDRKADVLEVEQSLQVAQLDKKRTCLQSQYNLREFKRIKQLAVRNLASVEAVDNAKTASQTQQHACESAQVQIGVVQAKLDFVQATLEKTRLRAPFAGVIAEINGEAGEYVTPSPPGIATPPAVDLIDYSCLYVTAPIDEVDASRLKMGLPTRVTLDAFRDREFDGELIRIAPYVMDLEKQARTVDIDVKLIAPPEDLTLLVGYSADTTVILESKTAVLRIPTEALLTGDQVWVVDKESGALHKKTVTSGISNWSFTEIITGLSEGDRVVRSPDQPGIAEGVIAVIVQDEQ
jgi:HlyD family secretion protein